MMRGNHILGSQEALFLSTSTKLASRRQGKASCKHFCTEVELKTQNFAYFLRQRAPLFEEILVTPDRMLIMPHGSMQIGLQNSHRPVNQTEETLKQLGTYIRTASSTLARDDRIILIDCFI